MICKRIAKYEPKFSECNCSEYTFSKKMWVSICRLPDVGNLTDFFKEMTISLTKVTPKYDENIIVMGDFNTDIKCKDVGLNNLSDSCDLFHLEVHSCKVKKH